ncbi:hypothetical protein MRX96_001278 [Rhipicephalus microplus]
MPSFPAQAPLFSHPSGAAAPAITSPGYPTASGRPAEKVVNEAPGQSHRSEKLMQELIERHPGCPRQQEHKLPARAPQQPKPRTVLTALRPSQSAVSQPQPPPPCGTAAEDLDQPARLSATGDSLIVPSLLPRKVPAKMVQDGPLLFGTCYGKGLGG